MEKKISPGTRRSPRIQSRLYPFLFGFSFLFFCFTAQAQIPVSGTVKDAKGTPLSGVSVNVKGSSIGNVTDNKGEYSVAVPNSTSVLVFSFVGYLEKEEAVN